MKLRCLALCLALAFSGAYNLTAQPAENEETVTETAEETSSVNAPRSGRRAGRGNQPNRRQRRKGNLLPQDGSPVLRTTPSDAATTARNDLNENDLALQPQAPRGPQPLVPLHEVAAIKMTGGAGYDSQPSMVKLNDSDSYVAFIRYTADAKDDIVVTHHKSGRPMDRFVSSQVISGKPGQFIRPVLAVSGDTVWCFWTTTQESQLASIWFSKLTGDNWSAPERLLPQLSSAHQNPEAAGTADGKLAVAYQVHQADGYDINVVQFGNGAWTAAQGVSQKQMDDWDPVVTYDKSGNLHVAWSAFDKGDYDIYVTGSTANGGNFAAPRRISARGSYDMHPWLAAAPDGKIWLSYDSVQIPRHGSSGGSTITGANLPKGGKADDAPHGGTARASGIEVRVLDGDKVLVPGNPSEEIIAPVGYKISHRALGKIVVGTDGVPWLVYRALVQPSPVWEPGVNIGYYWQLLARPYKNGSWRDAVSFLESDGYLEEPSVFAAPEMVHVAYSSEHRRSTVRSVEYMTKHANAHVAESTTRPLTNLYNHHHDFDGFLGWDGDVYLARLGKLEDTTPAPEDQMRVEDKPADSEVDTRLTRETGRHKVDVGGETYNLYWGDTHRHSNVSRCSVGTEPSPDDLYRYGIDINLYDFVALSDHAEHTTDYYWWKQQKTADLYHVPFFHSVLYNYEWSMGFPDGHHNAIFATRDNIKINGKLGAASTMAGGWEILAAGGYKAITAPHTSADPGMGTDWRSHDDRFQRVCEIFQSCRGSYEYDGCPRQHVNARNKAGFYWKGLEKGYKMGIICSSDHGYGCAYACVYSTTNTREAVWQSMWDRRCYGSTAYGLVMDVRSGEHWMGEEFKSSAAPKIDVYVRGSAPIRQIDIMGRSKILHTQGSVDAPLNTKEVKLSWSDPEWDTLSGEQWYYVRAIQTDDEIAWASPMWVTKQ